jgi:hypothetical protein
VELANIVSMMQNGPGSLINRPRRLLSQNRQRLSLRAGIVFGNEKHGSRQSGADKGETMTPHEILLIAKELGWNMEHEATNLMLVQFAKAIIETYKALGDGSHTPKIL